MGAGGRGEIKRDGEGKVGDYVWTKGNGRERKGNLWMMRDKE